MAHKLPLRLNPEQQLLLRVLDSKAPDGEWTVLSRQQWLHAAQQLSDQPLPSLPGQLRTHLNALHRAGLIERRYRGKLFAFRKTKTTG